MANPTTNFGWVMPTSASLVTNLPADFNTFGQAVDTSMAQLKGGTTGQILSKTSATDMAFTWITNDVGDITAVNAGTGISGGGTSGAVTITNSMATEITASGDIIVGTGSGTFDNLPIGTTGQVLTADTTVSPYKVKWATAASGNTGVGCALNRTTDLSVSNGSITQITFDSELFDTDSMHSTSTNTERITIPAGQGGYYLWTVKCTWDTSSTGTRQFIPYKNGVRQGAGGGPKGYDSLFDADGYTSCAVTFVIQLSAGDYISMAAYQDSGGSLNLRAEELFQSVMKLGS